MQYKCIKIVCGQTYESDEPEAYYCPSCVERNKQIAEQINAKIHPVYTESTISRYDAAPKVHGFPRANDFL